VRGLILDRCNYRLRVETDDVDFVVNPEVVAAWARQLHLFPQLRMLQAGNCFAPTSQPAHVFNRLVQVPNLTTLTLSDTQRILDNPMTETDKQILAACPRLETLELRLKWFVDDAEGLCQLSATLLVPMLATATRLRSLRLVGMPLLFISLRHLGSVPGLCRLDIDGEILEVPPGPRLFSTSCFPALRALRISDSTAHGQLARSLLQCCTSPQLTELRIYIGREDADVSAQDLLGSFALIGQHTRLAHLRLSLCGVAHAPPASLFRSLPPLQHLTSLWLSTPHASAPLASDDVLVVVSLFPRLVRWHVGTEGKQDGAPASLNTLLRILRGRPALRLLPVVIASGDPPAGDVVAAFGTHGYGPYLQADSGHEIDGLWAMIAKLFPRVKMDRYDILMRIGRTLRGADASFRCKYVQTRTLKEALQAF
jgi:hypothetical protein